jgi:hypothetical protein
MSLEVKGIFGVVCQPAQEALPGNPYGQDRGCRCGALLAYGSIGLQDAASKEAMLDHALGEKKDKYGQTDDK